MYRENRFKDIKIPDNLDQVIDSAIAKGKRMQKRRTGKRIIAACSGMAAAVALFAVLCISFPALAAQIPFISGIFENTEKVVSYKGDYSNEAEQLVSQAETEKVNSYIQENNGVRVAISEVYYNSMALYLGISIESEESFPADFIRTKNMEDYVLDYDILAIMGTQKFSFRDSEFLWALVEGSFMDANTFVGIYRIDLANSRNEDGSQLEIPDNFSLDLEIDKITGDIFGPAPEQDAAPDGYEGSWKFSLDVALDTSQTETVIVDDVNEEGIGIKKVERTPYEIRAEKIIPEGKENYDYFIAICDANGDMMETQGGYAETYQTYGRNTDKVYVYVCDYMEYMDELKGERWLPGHEDDSRREGYKNFKEFLDERALYGTEVIFTD